MPHGDESQRNFNQNRGNFGERSQNYSPSVSYNYNPGGTQTNQQHPRRRTDRYKRDMHNFNDRIVKQNNTIIKLLKEISDKLSAGNPQGNEGQSGSGRSRGRRNDRRQKQQNKQHEQDARAVQQEQLEMSSEQTDDQEMAYQENAGADYDVQDEREDED